MHVEMHGVFSPQGASPTHEQQQGAHIGACPPLLTLLLSVTRTPPQTPPHLARDTRTRNAFSFESNSTPPQRTCKRSNFPSSSKRRREGRLMVAAVGMGARASRATATGSWASKMYGAHHRVAPCVLSRRWGPCGRQAEKGWSAGWRVPRINVADTYIARVTKSGMGSAQQWLAVRGLVSMGRREAHLPLERRERQIRCGQGKHGGARPIRNACRYPFIG